ncbi:hypothetical protein [Streptomyces griseomycini]|uniref:Uncharacterized protein n=1 Tax=Streptomyces griseomycini TaxID=66895 RepID=A0A7W7PNV6_9ACTN|nr:hypothetical protein [Streptomyces griseomycini]MBB4896809.1 hypothetical protein [Streptomyces griseomycini]
MTKASMPGPLAPDGGPSGPTAAHELSVGPSFLAVVQQLESDLAGLRVEPADARPARRPDESIAT